VVGRQLALRPEPSSVRDARRYVAAELSAAGFDGAVMSAELLVSELVTNAILHARTPIHVTVDTRGDTARIGVADESALSPRVRSHSVDSGTGRGLLLVERLASAWGVESENSGKVVWFELPRYPADADLWGDIQEA
jgi:signal transduction histidine kinase